MRKLKDATEKDIISNLDFIDIMKAYDNLDNDEEYILSKQDILKIINSFVTDFLYDLRDQIADLYFNVEMLFETDVSDNDVPVEVLYDRIKTLNGKLYHQYLISLDHDYNWKFIPYTFEDFYKMTVKGLNLDFEKFGIDFNLIFVEIDLIDKVYKKVEELNNG